MPRKDKEANRAASREHYQLNKGRYRERNRRQKSRIAEELQKLKESTPCQDCNQFFPYYCMDYDHRQGTDKVANVGDMVRMNNRKKLMAEVDKCDLVCAICHRKRTFQRGQQYAQCVLPEQ